MDITGGTVKISTRSVFAGSIMVISNSIASPKPIDNYLRSMRARGLGSTSMLSTLSHQ